MEKTSPESICSRAGNDRIDTLHFADPASKVFSEVAPEQKILRPFHKRAASQRCLFNFTVQYHLLFYLFIYLFIFFFLERTRAATQGNKIGALGLD